MARYFDIHPANPQRRSLTQVAGIVRAGGVIAYPTDSCYALGCQLGNRDGMARIRSIRGLDDRHHLTLVCQDFAQLGQFVFVPNPVFRAIKAATVTMLRSRGVRPGRFHRSASGPCAYFSSAGATIVMSFIVCMGSDFLPVCVCWP